MTQDARQSPARPEPRRLAVRRPLRAPRLSWRENPRLGVANVGTILALLVAVGALTVAIAELRAWPMAIFLGAACVAIFINRIGMKLLREQIARDLRRQNREPEIHDTTIPLEIRRATRWFLPATLTVLFSAAFGAAAMLADPAFVILVAALALPLLGIAWGIARRRSGQLVAILDSTGLTSPEERISWGNVARIDLGYEPRSRVPFLTIALTKPLPQRGWMDRINSTLSRGASDRELTLRLHGVREDPRLLREIAQELWRGSVGAARVEGARAAQFRDAFAATTRFRDLPKRERMRQIKTLSWIAVIFVFAAHGIVADFLASEAWSRVSGWIAAGCTALGLWLLLRGPGLASLRRGPSSITYLSMFVVAFSILVLLSWTIVGRSLPDLYTRLAGQQREITAPLVLKYGARKCRYEIRGAFFDGRFPARYCATPTEAAALPRKGPMSIRVRETWFGTHLIGIRPVDPSWNR
jgi:hypothetical protein